MHLVLTRCRARFATLHANHPPPRLGADVGELSDSRVPEYAAPSTSCKVLIPNVLDLAAVEAAASAVSTASAASAAAVVTDSSSASAMPPETADIGLSEAELRELKEQMRQLRASRLSLRASLKERFNAWSSKGATVAETVS